MTSKLQMLLDDLGDTRVEVARTLRRAGVRGKRHAPYSCPISEYVRMKMRVPYVTAYLSHVCTLNDAQQSTNIAVTTTAARDFMERFDSGRIARDLIA